MNILRWIDRNLWSIPVLVFFMIELAFSLWSVMSPRPVLLAALPPTTREAMYSSLTGTASAFFGIALAVVAILVAFPKLMATSIEQGLVRARTIVIGSLLMSSFFMLAIVTTATIALAVDLRPAGNYAVTTLIEASCMASVTGLLVGGIGLAYVVVERSRH
jgi:hypothetical protein